LAPGPDASHEEQLHWAQRQSDKVMARLVEKYGDKPNFSQTTEQAENTEEMRVESFNSEPAATVHAPPALSTKGHEEHEKDQTTKDKVLTSSDRQQARQQAKPSKRKPRKRTVPNDAPKPTTPKPNASSPPASSASPPPPPVAPAAAQPMPSGDVPPPLPAPRPAAPAVPTIQPLTEAPGPERSLEEQRIRLRMWPH
jgi:hypothetical protein